MVQREGKKAREGQQGVQVNAGLIGCQDGTELQGRNEWVRGFSQGVEEDGQENKLFSGLIVE